MAGLFEDILTNLKEKKQEGKISGGYRYKDGKINIGGGYYGDDSMLEIDVNKDGGNILFKKRFADGGSTNGSGDKAFTGKVKELMEDGYEFGEAVKEAMRQGYAKGGITTAKRGLVDGPGSYSGQSAYTNVQRLGIETQIKQMYSDGLGSGNITKRLRLLLPNIANKINHTLISDYLTYAKRNLGLIKPDRVITNQHGFVRTVEEVQKAIDNAPKIKKGNKYYEMNAKDLEGRSRHNHVDASQSLDGKQGKSYVTRKEMDRYNAKGEKPKLNIKGPSKVVIIENAKTKSNQERGQKNRIANANAGSETTALNKKLSTKYVTERNNKLRQDLKSNPVETIAKIKNNKNIMFQLETSFNSKTGEFSSEKVSNEKIKNLIKAGMFSIEHTSPMSKGAKNTNFSTNLSLITNRANSKIMRPLDTWVNKPDSFKNFSDPKIIKVKDFLINNSLRVKINGMPGYFGDDTKLTAEERLAKQNDFLKLKETKKPEKSKVQSFFDKSNASNIYKNVRPAIDKFTTMFPGKADNALAAAIDFPMMYMSGLPFPAAAASSASMFLNQPILGKGINVALESASLTDEERFLKKANERKEGIETILRNAPSKAKNYLMNSKRTRPVRYGNIEDYLPDDDLSGIRSIKGVN